MPQKRPGDRFLESFGEPAQAAPMRPGDAFLSSFDAAPQQQQPAVGDVAPLASQPNPDAFRTDYQTSVPLTVTPTFVGSTPIETPPTPEAIANDQRAAAIRNMPVPVQRLLAESGQVNPNVGTLEDGPNPGFFGKLLGLLPSRGPARGIKTGMVQYANDVIEPLANIAAPALAPFGVDTSGPPEGLAGVYQATDPAQTPTERISDVAGRIAALPAEFASMGGVNPVGQAVSGIGKIVPGLAKLPAELAAFTAIQQAGKGANPQEIAGEAVMALPNMAVHAVGAVPAAVNAAMQPGTAMERAAGFMEKGEPALALAALGLKDKAAEAVKSRFGGKGDVVRPVAKGVDQVGAKPVAEPISEMPPQGPPSVPPPSNAVAESTIPANSGIQVAPDLGMMLRGPETVEPKPAVLPPFYRRPLDAIPAQETRPPVPPPEAKPVAQEAQVPVVVPKPDAKGYTYKLTPERDRLEVFSGGESIGFKNVSRAIQEIVDDKYKPTPNGYNEAENAILRLIDKPKAEQEAALQKVRQARFATSSTPVWSNPDGDTVQGSNAYRNASSKKYWEPLNEAARAEKTTIDRLANATPGRPDTPREARGKDIYVYARSTNGKMRPLAGPFYTHAEAVEAGKQAQVRIRKQFPTSELHMEGLSYGTLKDGESPPELLYPDLRSPEGSSPFPRTNTPGPATSDAPADAATGPVVKQPWEMTKADAVESAKAKMKAIQKEWTAIKKQRTKISPGDPSYQLLTRTRRGEDIGYRQKIAEAEKFALVTAEKYHKMDVATAIREGKSVPPEVLKDYPDLKPSSGQAAPPISPGESAPPAGLKTDVPSFRDWRVEQTQFKNSVRVVPNRIGQKFTPEQVTELTEWGKRRGLLVRSATPTTITFNDQSGKRVEISEYGIAGVKADAAKQHRLQREQETKSQKSDKRALADARESSGWIKSVFGQDAINPFNSQALSDFIEGKSSKYNSVVGGSMEDGLRKLGVLRDDNTIDWASLKQQYVQSEPDNATPNPERTVIPSGKEEEGQGRQGLLSPSEAQPPASGGESAPVESLRTTPPFLKAKEDLAKITKKKKLPVPILRNQEDAAPVTKEPTPAPTESVFPRMPTKGLEEIQNREYPEPASVKKARILARDLYSQIESRRNELQSEVEAAVETAKKGLKGNARTDAQEAAKNKVLNGDLTLKRLWAERAKAEDIYDQWEEKSREHDKQRNADEQAFIEQRKQEYADTIGKKKWWELADHLLPEDLSTSEREAIVKARGEGGDLRSPPDGFEEVLPKGFKEGSFKNTLGNWNYKSIHEKNPVMLGEAKMLKARAEANPPQWDSALETPTWGGKIALPNGIAKLKEFIKEVPEFAIDPAFEVTKYGELKFEDGGTYIFKPEAIGVDLGDKPGDFVGQRIAINLNDVKVAKGQFLRPIPAGEYAKPTTVQDAVKQALVSMKGKAEKVKYTLSVSDGEPEIVTGEKYGDVAVRKGTGKDNRGKDKTEYYIDHIQSGLRMDHFSNVADARAYAIRVSDIHDWPNEKAPKGWRPPDDLLIKLRALSRDPFSALDIGDRYEKQVAKSLPPEPTEPPSSGTTLTAGPNIETGLKLAREATRNLTDFWSRKTHGQMVPIPTELQAIAGRGPGSRKVAELMRNRSDYAAELHGQNLPQVDEIMRPLSKAQREAAMLEFGGREESADPAVKAAAEALRRHDEATSAIAEASGLLNADGEQWRPNQSNWINQQWNPEAIRDMRRESGPLWDKAVKVVGDALEDPGKAVDWLREYRTKLVDIKDPLAKNKRDFATPTISGAQLKRRIIWPREFLQKDLVESYVEHKRSLLTKAAEAKVIGAKGENLRAAFNETLNEVMDQARARKQDIPKAKHYAEQIMKDWFGRELGTREKAGGEDVIRKLMGASAIAHLSLGTPFPVVNVLYGMAMNLQRNGIMRTLKESVRNVPAFIKRGEGYKAAVESGSLDWAGVSSTFADLHIPTAAKEILTGFAGATEAFNRTVAAQAGKDAALASVRGLHKIFNKSRGSAEKIIKSRQYRDLLDRGFTQADVLKIAAKGELTPEQLRRAQRGSVEISQFLARPQDLPRGMTGPYARMFYQFWPMAYKQAQHGPIHALREAGHGNLAPLVRFIPIAIAAGMTTSAVRSLFYGQQHTPEDETKIAKFLSYMTDMTGVMDRGVEVITSRNKTVDELQRQLTPVFLKDAKNLLQGVTSAIYGGKDKDARIKGVRRALQTSSAYKAAESLKTRMTGSPAPLWWTRKAPYSDKNLAIRNREIAARKAKEARKH